MLDVRSIIGTLLAIYGVILTVLGVVGDKAYGKTGNINANLIAGICLLVAAAVFLVWARIAPLSGPDDVPDPNRKPPAHH